MWQRTGARTTYLGRMDGSEPGLTATTLEALGRLLSGPLHRLQNEGVEGPLSPAFHRLSSEAPRKPPPRACGCKKPSEEEEEVAGRRASLTPQTKPSL